jgi:hypothetical protein
MSEQQAAHFLLGSNSPQGFVSHFDQLTDGTDGWRKYIIKGGPGSGKSTMMRKISEHFASLEQELIFCSSDLDSLDGVIIPALKFCIADGTAPHVIEPQYPGALESIIDIAACWDEGALYQNRKDIIALNDAISGCHAQCCRFLGAAASLSGDTYRLTLEAVDTEKLAGYCKRLAEKEFCPVKKGPGTEKIRLLSAVTNQGVHVFTDTVRQICDRVYVLNDDYGAVSRILLHTLRSKALAAGYDIVCSYCPLGPHEKLEGLLIPERRLGFVTSNRQHDFSLSLHPYRTINSQRFLNAGILKKSKRRFSFNRRAVAQMVHQAEFLLRDAKALHDELEHYYISATDFKKVNQLTKRIIAKVEAFS